MADLDWKAALAGIAPTVATALGGPFAGLAASVIGRLLLGKGQDAQTTVEEAQQAIAQAIGTPEGLARLKEAEIEMQRLKNELQIEMAKIEVDDRKNARAREIALRDWTPKILAVLVVGGFIMCVYLVLRGLVPGLDNPTTATLVGAVIGYASAKADTVVSYFFGSSAGSKEKTDAMTAALTRR